MPPLSPPRLLNFLVLSPSEHVVCRPLRLTSRAWVAASESTQTQATGTRELEDARGFQGRSPRSRLPSLHLCCMPRLYLPKSRIQFDISIQTFPFPFRLIGTSHSEEAKPGSSPLLPPRLPPPQSSPSQQLSPPPTPRFTQAGSQPLRLHIATSAPSPARARPFNATSWRALPLGATSTATALEALCSPHTC